MGTFRKHFCTACPKMLRSCHHRCAGADWTHKHTCLHTCVPHTNMWSVKILGGNTGRNMWSRKCGFGFMTACVWHQFAFAVSGTHCADPGRHWLTATCFVFYQTTSPISKAQHTGSELVASSPTFIHLVPTSALGNALTDGLRWSFLHHPIKRFWPFSLDIPWVYTHSLLVHMCTW